MTNSAHRHGPRLSALAVVVLAVGSAAGDWKAPFQVTQREDSVLVQSVAIGPDGTVHVVWEEGILFRDNDVFHASQPPGGDWTSPTDLSASPDTASAMPQITVTPDGVPHVVWEDCDDDADTCIILYTALEGGSWLPPQPLSAPPDEAFDPALDSGPGGEIYVFWRAGGTPFGPSEVVFTERPVGGGFQTPITLSQPNASGSNIRQVVDGEHLYLVWTDQLGPGIDTFFAERPPGGSWSAPFNVSSSSEDSQEPELAVGSDGSVHVAWEQRSFFTSDGDIYYAQRPAGGAWSAPENASSSLLDSCSPTLAVSDDGTVHLAWYDGDSFNEEEVYHSSRPPAGSWGPAENVSNTPTSHDDLRPFLDLHEGQLAVYWERRAEVGPSGNDLMESLLEAGGWGTPRVLTPRRVLDTFVRAPERAPDGTLHWIFAAAYGVLDPDDIFQLRDDGPPPTPPTTIAFEPDGGSGTVGQPHTWSATYGDANGAGQLQRVFLLVNEAITPADGVVVGYDWPNDLLLLLSESGSGVAASCGLGSSGTISHSYVSVDCGASSIQRDEDELTVSWVVTYTACPPGGCGTYSAAELAIDGTSLRGVGVVGSWTLDP